MPRTALLVQILVFLVLAGCGAPSAEQAIEAESYDLPPEVHSAVAQALEEIALPEGHIPIVLLDPHPERGAHAPIVFMTMHREVAERFRVGRRSASVNSQEVLIVLNLNEHIGDPAVFTGSTFPDAIMFVCVKKSAQTEWRESWGEFNEEESRRQFANHQTTRKGLGAGRLSGSHLAQSEWDEDELSAGGLSGRYIYVRALEQANLSGLPHEELDVYLEDEEVFLYFDYVGPDEMRSESDALFTKNELLKSFRSVRVLE